MVLECQDRLQQWPQPFHAAGCWHACGFKLREATGQGSSAAEPRSVPCRVAVYRYIRPTPPPRSALTF